MTNPNQYGTASQQQSTAAANQYGLQTNYQDYQTQAQVTDQANAQSAVQSGVLAATGGLPGLIMGPVVTAANQAHAQAQFNDKLDNAAYQLKQGLDMRSAPGFGGANYLGYPHAQLYDMATNGNDPGTIGAAGDTWIDIGNGLTNFQQDIAKSLASSETSWTGQGAEQARKSVADLGNQGAKAGQAAQLSGVVTHQQANAASAVKNMPPPPNPPFNPQQAQQLLNSITNPVQFMQQAAADTTAYFNQNQAHQQAAQTIQHYDTTMSQIANNMPAFAPAPPVAKPGPGPSPTPPPPGSVNPPGPGGPGGIPPYSRPGGPGSGGYPTPGPGGPGSGGYPTPSPGGTGTSGVGGYNPGGGNSGGYGPGGYGTGSGSGSDPGLGAPAMMPMGPMGGGGFGGGGAGGLGGGGKFGAGGVGKFGTGSAGSGSGTGQGGRSGIGATAAEEGAIGSGVAAAKPGGSTTGAGGSMGGRGGKKEEDKEHNRPSWLVEGDKTIWGTDERTVPPVIGA